MFLSQKKMKPRKTDFCQSNSQASILKKKKRGRGDLSEKEGWKEGVREGRKKGRENISKERRKNSNLC